MKKKILLAATIITGCFMLSAPYVFTYAVNPPLGNTNAPGETNCNQSGCHNGNPLNDASGQLSLKLLDGTTEVNLLEPSKDYTVQVSATKAGTQGFGFQTTALDKNNAGAGTFTSLDHFVKVTNNTQSGRSYAYHAHAINADGNGSFSVDFKWTAPAEPQGPITFYTAANAANLNGNSLGDFIFTNSNSFSSTVSIEKNELTAAKKIYLFPNPASEKIFMHFSMQKPGQVNMELYTLDGKLATQTQTTLVTEGTQLLELNINQLPSGIYLLKFNVGTESLLRKVFVK